MPYGQHHGMVPPSAPGYGGGGFDCGRNTVIDGRYRVVDEAGRGNFARVLRAVDSQTGQMVAVKMLRPEYRRDAQFELEVLKAVTRNDPRGAARVCKMLKHFDWCGCPCFTMPLHGPSLKSRRLGVRHCGRGAIQRLAKQLGRALKYLHFDCRLVHTDLKPENILLDTHDASTVQGIGDNWVICDLGSASFYTERPDQDLITTRPYRAVEAVVGAPWSYAADMWSVACILYEVFMARPLFEATTDHQHLNIMQRKLGPIPTWVSDQASQQAKRTCFDGNRLRPGPSMSGEPLTQTLASEPDLADALLRMLDYDPALRMRADELCHHPFTSGASSQPDAPVLTHLPPSPYTSQRIRTPGGRMLSSGGQRPRADRLLSQQGREAAQEQQYGRGMASHDVRAGSQPLSARRVGSDSRIDQQRSGFHHRLW